MPQSSSDKVIGSLGNCFFAQICWFFVAHLVSPLVAQAAPKKHRQGRRLRPISGPPPEVASVEIARPRTP